MTVSKYYIRKCIESINESIGGIGDGKYLTFTCSLHTMISGDTTTCAGCEYNSHKNGCLLVRFQGIYSRRSVIC